MRGVYFLACSLLLSLFAAGPAAAADDEAGEVPPPENWRRGGEVGEPAPAAADGDPAMPVAPGAMLDFGAFALDVHGRVQAMVGMVGEDANVDAGDVLSRDGFRIRRARLGVSGRISEQWLFDLEMDLIDEDNGGNALIDASITWRPCDWGRVRVGAFKPPFSRTLLQSTGHMQFMERPAWVNRERATDSHMLDLDREVGLSLGGRVSLFFYELGVFNGSPGFSKGDLNDGLMYVLRLGAGQGDMGASEADLARGEELRWQLALNGYLNHDTAAEYRGAGVDLSAKWYGASFHAEALWAKGIPNAATEDVDSLLDESERWGMYAQAGYLLPFDFMDLELAVRFAIMDDQVHIDDEGDQWELTAGVNAYFLGDQVKLMLHYQLRQELEGADLANDLLAAMLQLKF